MNTLKSENERYGFYGTMSLDGCADAAWEIAMTLIAEDTGADPEEARAFLDSRWGRHFADSVHCFLHRYPLKEAIEAAIEEWNSWKLSRRTRRCATSRAWFTQRRFTPKRYSKKALHDFSKKPVKSTRNNLHPSAGRANTHPRKRDKSEIKPRG